MVMHSGWRRRSLWVLYRQWLLAATDARILTPAMFEAAARVLEGSRSGPHDEAFLYRVFNLVMAHLPEDVTYMMVEFSGCTTSARVLAVFVCVLRARGIGSRPDWLAIREAVAGGVAHEALASGPAFCRAAHEWEANIVFLRDAFGHTLLPMADVAVGVQTMVWQLSSLVDEVSRF